MCYNVLHFVHSEDDIKEARSQENSTMFEFPTFSETPEIGSYEATKCSFYFVHEAFLQV